MLAEYLHTSKEISHKSLALCLNQLSQPTVTLTGHCSEKMQLAQKGWKRKGPKEWDTKAQSFSSRTKHNDYTNLFIQELPLEPSLSVLDIGSGPGTLALPIAKRVHNVTAIDFSEGMLDILNQQAKDEHTSNIKTVHCSWEDDWHNKGIVPP